MVKIQVFQRYKCGDLYISSNFHYKRSHKYCIINLFYTTTLNTNLIHLTGTGIWVQTEKNPYIYQWAKGDNLSTSAKKDGIWRTSYTGNWIQTRWVLTKSKQPQHRFGSRLKQYDGRTDQRESRTKKAKINNLLWFENNTVQHPCIVMLS